MKCPHCTTSIHGGWAGNTIASGYGVATTWRVRYMVCPECKGEILQLGQAEHLPNKIVQPSEWSLIYPRGSSRGPVPSDVPKPIADDYDEAALALALSPKASAALSRRCLQSVLRQAGYTQKDLAKQIEAALAEPDTRKALPTGVHTILDAVRNFGNFSAHAINDQTTLQVIDVDDHEAEYCLDILDAVFDHYYVRPAEAQRKKAALNAKLQAAGKPHAK